MNSLRPPEEPTVCVVMMQKDEGDVFAAWLSHYAGLFGPENLTILDNGSSDPKTLHLLNEAELHGATVIRHLTARHDFQQKGGHFTNIIKIWDATKQYDYALGVDCDEILAVFTDSGLTTEKSAIIAELVRLRTVRNALRLDMSFFNVPSRPGWFAPVRHFHKGFLPARSIEAIDNGQHQPTSRLAPGYTTTRLTYLHWHNRDYEKTRELARLKLRERVDVDDHEALRSFQRRGGPGAHMVPVLLSTLEEYEAIYANDLRIHVPAGGTQNILEAPNPVLWDAEKYLERNPDVRHYGLTPLHHYLSCGFREGRSRA